MSRPAAGPVTTNDAGPSTTTFAPPKYITSTRPARISSRAPDARKSPTSAAAGPLPQRASWTSAMNATEWAVGAALIRACAAASIRTRANAVRPAVSTAPATRQASGTGRPSFRSQPSAPRATTATAAANRLERSALRRVRPRPEPAAAEEPPCSCGPPSPWACAVSCHRQRRLACRFESLRNARLASGCSSNVSRRSRSGRVSEPSCSPPASRASSESGRGRPSTSS